MYRCCITCDITFCESQLVALTPSKLNSPAAVKSPRRSETVISSVVQVAEGGARAESKKLPSSRFKGVVPQPNGRWGAQIYEKHRRVWLGTFNEEDEAARVYDIAAQRFRGRHTMTNFKPLEEGSHDKNGVEIAFLNSRSKAEIVDLLRKHTYYDELEQSKRNYGGFENNGKPVYKAGGLFGSKRIGKTCEPMFEKTVTPSDIGKLNRLVIPKQHEEKHFPLENGACSKGILLNFEHMNEKVWRFRYSYWNSSQSYVLTKGWSRFVKENNMKAGDVVSFQKSTGPENKCYIECKPRNGPPTLLPVHPFQILRLFGVNIVNDGTGSGKMNREMEIFEFGNKKKQRVIVDAM